MSRVLITGGSGFLGSNLAAGMSEAGWGLRLLDVNPPAFPLGAGWEFVLGDVRDGETMKRAVEGCDVVIDNAALVPVTRSSLSQLRSVNVDGCRVTLAAARAAGAYVVHVSSSSIYGVPKRLPVTEESPLMPFEDYGRSKAEAEELVHRARDSGMVISSLRSRALLGRGRLGLFELVFSRIRAGRRVPMFGGGTNRVQMCDARDFTSATLAAIHHRANGDYGIGAAEFGTVRQDLASLIARLRSTAKLQPIPEWAIRAVLMPLDRLGRSPFTPWHWHSAAADFWCTLDKANDELGWRPSYSNVDALENAYNQYLAGHHGESAHSRPLTGALARLLRANQRGRRNAS